MQMHNVETNVGTTIWLAASMIASSSPLWLPPASASSRWVLMFSIMTVASSTRMPTASARPPSVMTLMAWPSQDSTRIELRIDSGMEVATIRVERQLPTNSRTAMPARHAAVTISCTTSAIEARTNVEASLSGVIVMPGGSVLLNCGSMARMPATMASVEASPLLRI